MMLHEPNAGRQVAAELACLVADGLRHTFFVTDANPLVSAKYLSFAEFDFVAACAPRIISRPCTGVNATDAVPADADVSPRIDDMAPPRDAACCCASRCRIFFEIVPPFLRCVSGIRKCPLALPSCPRLNPISSCSTSSSMSAKPMRFAALRISDVENRSFIFRTRFPPRFFLASMSGRGNALGILAGGGSCALLSFLRMSARSEMANVAPLLRSSWYESTRAASATLAATRRAAFLRYSCTNAHHPPYACQNTGIRQTTLCFLEARGHNARSTYRWLLLHNLAVVYKPRVWQHGCGREPCEGTLCRAQ
eukprot:m.146760 g.146760  ORF g.146760 m.146760 type:complete len:309 (-) comp17775_c0_seq2:895-1821(-)